MMKTLAAFLFAPLALASVHVEHQPMSNTNMDSVTPVAGTSNTTSGPYCGVGYTYCGYILKEQKRKHCLFSSHTASVHT